MKYLRSKMNGVVAAALLGGAVFASSSHAAVITPPLGSFNLVNSTADGSVSVLNNLSFVLTGGNSGSGLQGETDFSFVAQTAGTVQFTYSYSSADDPTFDAAGYLVGTSLVQFADRDGISGASSFNVLAGQTYGWYVATADNLGEPGILSVTVIPGVSTVPEPGAFALFLSGVAALAFLWIRRTRAFCVSGDNR